MGKNYDLYSPYQRTIDNLKRRIRGYEKMKKDLTKQYRKTNKENQELKKQLEAKGTQQKEFIECLENEINKINEQIKNYDIWHEAGTDINFLILKKQFNIEILSKYKEIIGDDK